MQQAAQALLVYELTHSMLALGLLGACSTLPILVLTLPAGVLADRISKRNILLVTQTLAMVQAFVLAILTFSGVVQVWHVMLLALFLGVANSLDMPARHAMVVELAGRDDLLNAVSINSSAFNAARIVGPAAAGMLIPVTGMAGCFLINALTFLALIFALVGIRPKQPSGEARGPMLPQIRDGLSWAKGQPIARTVLAMIAVSSIFAMSYGTLLPVFALDIFHAGPRGYGFLMSSYAVGALASALTLTAFGHRWRPGSLVTRGALFFPVALFCFSVSPVYGLAIGSLFLTGAGMMVFNAVANTMLQKLSPDAMRGRVMSMRTLLFAGMMPIGSLQMGAIGEWLGPRAAVGIGAAVCMIAALTAWRLVPALRRSD